MLVQKLWHMSGVMLLLVMLVPFSARAAVLSLAQP